MILIENLQLKIENLQLKNWELAINKKNKKNYG